MKLLFGYTLDYLKRNRRSSFAIMVAILMTSTMMSALCGFFYNTYADNLSLVLSSTGNWHGELFDATKGSALPTVESFESVESIMIKGDWKVAEIDDPRRDYIVWREANSEYWSSMPEGNSSILEGRAPEQAQEIAISKQYFDNHPGLKIGDSITWPIGNRVDSEGNVVAPQSVSKQEEKFVKTDTVTLTVVGKLDATTSSTVPGYYALGFLDEERVLPEDDLTIYFRFNNIHDTYKELPKIAEAVGYEKDEYGNYLLRYNTDYLVRKGVLSPEEQGLLPTLLANQMPLMFGVIGIMVVGVFVLIIHNAFALSSSSRLSQLGIFSSVGATPKQIKRSVVSEALILTAIPLPLGLLLGQVAIALLLRYVNGFNSESDIDMTFVLGWQSVVPAILLTLLTVWWSALIPARKIARMVPIEAIRRGGTEKIKKPKGFSSAGLRKIFGLPGELASNALQARKNSYRTAVVSLTLSFLVLASFLCINSASTASKAVYKSDALAWAERDISVVLNNVATEEDFNTIYNKFGNMEEVTTAVWYNLLRTAYWVPEETGFSTEFVEKGGFPALEKKMSGMQIPLLREGNRRVNISIIGMDDESFADYCSTLGIEPEQFYDKEKLRSILYHTVSDITTGTKRNPVNIPFFSVKQGDTMTLTETTIDSHEGDYTFDVEIGAITDKMPPLSNARFSYRYSAVQIVPMSQVRSLASHFAVNSAVKLYGSIQVKEPSQITPVKLRMDEICDSYFGSGDYSLFDENEYYEDQAAGATITAVMFGFIAGLLGVIGLSNAWATVRGTLNARKREFAMLRSVGLPPRGLKKMLTLEAVFLGIYPILFSIPIVVILQIVFLSVNEVTFFEWLRYAPWQPILIYISAVLAVTVAAYVTGGRRLLGENIIDAIKMDSI